MKFLLIVYMFTVSPQGNPENFQVLSQPFETLEQCNYAGANIRQITKTDTPKYDVVKTLSYCVRPEDFIVKYDT